MKLTKNIAICLGILSLALSGCAYYTALANIYLNIENVAPDCAGGLKAQLTQGNAVLLETPVLDTEKGEVFAVEPFNPFLSSSLGIMTRTWCYDSQGDETGFTEVFGVLEASLGRGADIFIQSGRSPSRGCELPETARGQTLCITYE